jgi:hypothetical protein
MSSNSQGFSEVYKIEQLLKSLKATVIFLKVRTRPSAGVSKPHLGTRNPREITVATCTISATPMNAPHQ